MVDGCQGSARTCPMCGYDNALIEEGYERKRRATGETGDTDYESSGLPDRPPERPRKGEQRGSERYAIVGGVTVKRGNVPWQVNLFDRNCRGKCRGNCGGTIVAMDVSFIADS